MPSYDVIGKGQPRVTVGNLPAPFIVDRPDICPYCKAQRIELLSFNGYPQNYSSAVDAYLRGYNISFNKYEIRSMRCKSCNKEFTIDWTSGFPMPLTSTFRTDVFFSRYLNEA